MSSINSSFNGNNFKIYLNENLLSSENIAEKVIEQQKQNPQKKRDLLIRPRNIYKEIREEQIPQVALITNCLIFLNKELEVKSPKLVHFCRAIYSGKKYKINPTLVPKLAEVLVENIKSLNEAAFNELKTKAREELGDEVNEILGED